MNPRISIWALACALIFSGCTSEKQLYSGHKLPAQKIVVLTVPAASETPMSIDSAGGMVHGTELAMFGTVVEAVDGVPVGKRCKQMELLPGNHVVKVGWWGNEFNSISPDIVKFTAVAGRHYETQILHAAMNERGVVCVVGIVELESKRTFK